MTRPVGGEWRAAGAGQRLMGAEGKNQLNLGG